MEDDLLIKFLLRETSAEESLLVNSWIAADAANQKHFSQVKLIWDSSKKLVANRDLDENKAWDRFQSRLKVAESPVRPAVKFIYQRYSWLKIAAVLFIVAAGWSVYMAIFQFGTTTLTAQQEVLTGTLPDGSMVTMNKNSVLTYPKVFGGKERKIKLAKGDVFFNIAPDKTKPFIIEVGKVNVKVVGTSFNVKHLENETEVIVETGVVRVSRGNQQVELRPGEKVIISEHTNELMRERSTDQLYNYYRTNRFVANSTPLWRMVEILNEAYDANIIIEEERLRNLTLTTTFRDEKLDTILNVIAETFNLKVVYEGNKIILRLK